MRDINKLSDILKKNSNITNPLNWLKNYIEFLKNNSPNTEQKKICPNQNKNFETLEKLNWEDDIPESINNFYNNYKRNTDDKNYDIRNSLLSREIDTFKWHNRKTQKEIISEIEFIFLKSEDEKLKNAIAEEIIKLIPLDNSTDKFITINSALKEFNDF